MTVYALAQLTIHDRVPYGRYQARFMDILNRYDGKVLASDESPLVLEGTWDREKIVLLSFADQTLSSNGQARRNIWKSRRTAKQARMPSCCW